MKIIMFTTILALASTTAMAADNNFDANELTTKITSGNLSFGVTTVFNEDTSDVDVFETEATVFDTSVAGFDVLGKTKFGYSDIDQTVTLGASGEASREVYTTLTAYGELGADYIAATGALSDGEWFITPELGVLYALTDKIQPFAEVRYSYNVSDEWEGVGGELEIGTSFAVTDKVTVTPSLVRTYDVEDEATNFALEATLSF